MNRLSIRALPYLQAHLATERPELFAAIQPVEAGDHHQIVELDDETLTELVDWASERLDTVGLEGDADAEASAEELLLEGLIDDLLKD